LPYFIRAEDNERGANDYHGTGGPLPVSDGRARSTTCADFIEAAVATRLEPHPDFNRAAQDGVGWYQVTQRDGRRASAAVGYLHPAMERPNLEVRTDCHVLKVLFEGTRAVGVQAVGAGGLAELRAEREVIVSGGTYNSPQILML